MMKNFLSRFIKVPVTNEVKEIEVPELWEVRWTSRYGEYSRSTKPEVCAFYTENEAQAFKESLQAAFKLIKHTSGTFVEIKKVN